MRSPFVLLPVAAGIMWGAAGVFVRTLSEQGMDSTTIVFTRVSLAAVMMLTLILAADRRMLRFRPRDLWMFVLCAVSMVALNLFYTLSIERVSLSLAAVLLSMSPVFMLLMAAAIFKERITARKVACMLVSVLGCVLVSGFLDSGGEVSAAGIAAGLASAFFYALYGIASKRAAAGGYSVYTILFYCLLFSTVGLLPLTDLGAVAGYASGGIGNVLYLILHGAVASFLPYILYTMAMARIEAGTASILAACGEPAAAAVFGVIVFGEMLSPLMLLGMVLAVGSMAVMCMPPKTKSGDAGTG